MLALVMILVLWQADLPANKVTAIDTALQARGAHIDQPATVYLGAVQYRAVCFRLEQVPPWKAADTNVFQAVSTKVRCVQMDDGAAWLRANGYTNAVPGG